MAPVPPVAEVPVFPLRTASPPLHSLQPSLRSLLPRPRALAHLDGYERGYFKHVLYATLPPPPPATTTSLLSHYQPIFPLSSPSCLVLCDLLKPGRHVITLLDTKNSRQPVFFGGGGREGTRKTI